MSRFRRQVPLSTQLILVGLLAACTPFLVALLTVIALPRSTVEHMTASDIDRDLAIANASMSSARGQVRGALIQVPAAAMQQAAQTGDTTAVKKALTAKLAKGVRIQVLDRAVATTPQPLAPGATPTLGIARVVVGDKVVALDQIVTRSVLAKARPTGHTQLAVVVDDVVRSSSGGTGLPLGTAITPTDKGALEKIDHHAGTGRLLPLTERAAEHDPVLVGFRSGGNITLVMQSRGSDLTAALLLLLASGLSTALAIVVLMGRRLNSVADSAARMAGGDLASRLPVIGADAGARLSASLNRMGRDLEQRISELEVLVDRSSRVLAATEDGVCLWGSSGTLEVWNDAAARMAAAGSRGEITHSTLADATTTAVATTDALRNETALGSRRIMLPVGDGTTSVAVDLVVTKAGDGGILQVFRDASRTISIEQARENFLVTAAHELRTPLVPLLGFLPMLHESSDPASPGSLLDPETARLALEQSTSAAHRLADIVDALVDGSMLARDQITVQPAPHQVTDIINAAVARCEIDRDTLVIDVADTLTTLCDARAVQRAVAELLDNAAKYGDGSDIVITAGEVDGTIEIDVISTGAHVPTTAREQVFEPFFRLDPEQKQGVGGVGLGLFVARRLVEATGGQLEIVESDGQSTALRMWLPATVAAMTVAAATS